MDLKEIGGAGWIDVAQDRGTLRAVVNAVMNLKVPDTARSCWPS